MTSLTVTKSYVIDADKLWDEVKKGEGMDTLLPSMITSCRVEGFGQGAKRICGTEHGDIKETILLVDDDTMTFTYSIDNDDAPLPVSGYIGTVNIAPEEEGKVVFSWSVEFMPKGMEENEVSAMLRDVFTQLLDNYVQKVSA